MGLSTYILLIFLPWFFCSNFVSTLSLEKLEQIERIADNGLRTRQQRSITKELDAKELSDIQQSFTGLTDFKRTTFAGNTTTPPLINEIIKAYVSREYSIELSLGNTKIH